MHEIHASDVVKIKWAGSHTRLDQGVEFVMPGVQFTVRVMGAHSVQALMSMGGNFFTVRRVRTDVPGACHNYMLTSASSEPSWVDLAVNLDPSGTYDISVTKRTEPQLRSVFSSFSTVLVTRLAVPDGHFLPVPSSSPDWIEVIGDSDACGFGVSGEISSTSSVLSMDPELENVELAWGSVAGHLLGHSVVSTIASSGKGIVQNAPMCGSETLPQIWALRHWAPDDPPKAVLVLAGGNDFYSGSGPDDSEFVEGFSEFLNQIRLFRGNDVPVYVFQCSASCASSAGSPERHGKEDEENVSVCEKLAVLTKAAVELVGGRSKRVFYHTVDVTLELPTDYAIMMHWSEAGQRKIAHEMVRFIRSVSDFF